ncbi:MAG: UDP-3-O-[3-hydroxymyristoyl] N-acetylglucosamine deacetylase [Bacteroidales bacterium]|nr:UDP-3-O-[3-hydroxymyristoyl] N-acetylglucosamine deacetylase [Bacteroidales bacterium]
MEYQNTINKEFRLTGPGLHTGRTVTVTVKPAPDNFGIAFRRTDRTNIVTQPAFANKVGETSRGTTLGSGRHTIATIEHLMSALHGMKVDNVLVELDGGEVPILDGSARPWLLQLVRVGIRQQQSERKAFTINEPLHFEFEPTGSVFDAEPCDHFAVDCVIDFPNSVIGCQHAEMNDLSEYAASIAPCRTFVFLHEIEPLLHLNLIKGGSLDNALVFVNKELTSKQLKRLAKTFNKDVSNFRVHDGVLNTTDPYFPNEPARHKLLDFVGDIRLVGQPINAKFKIYKPGHKANNAFARYLMEYFRNNK